MVPCRISFGSWNLDRAGEVEMVRFPSQNGLGAFDTEHDLVTFFDPECVPDQPRHGYLALRGDLRCDIHVDSLL
jgi:hypothetical protein